MDYFDISNYEVLGDIHSKQEFWVIEFTKKNELPTVIIQMNMSLKDL
jgi:hypothetical protein